MGRQFNSVDDAQPATDEIVYRPMSPMAGISLVVGIISMISISLLEDLSALSLAVMPIVGILMGYSRSAGRQALRHEWWPPREDPRHACSRPPI